MLLSQLGEELFVYYFPFQMDKTIFKERSCARHAPGLDVGMNLRREFVPSLSSGCAQLKICLLKNPSLSLGKQKNLSYSTNTMFFLHYP